MIQCTTTFLRFFFFVVVAWGSIVWKKTPGGCCTWQQLFILFFFSDPNQHPKGMPVITLSLKHPKFKIPRYLKDDLGKCATSTPPGRWFTQMKNKTTNFINNKLRSVVQAAGILDLFPGNASKAFTLVQNDLTVSIWVQISSFEFCGFIITLPGILNVSCILRM